jgi:hypothetical protein
MDFVVHELSVQHDTVIVQQATTSGTLFFSSVGSGVEMSIDSRSDSGSQRGARARREHKPSPRSIAPPSPAQSAGQGSNYLPPAYGRSSRPALSRPKATFSAGAPYNKKLGKKLFEGLTTPTQSAPAFSNGEERAGPPTIRQGFLRSEWESRRLSPQPSPRLLPQMEMLPASVACEELLCELIQSTMCE